ncbi:AAA family ATPase [Desulfovibrio gilichinskyi]|uniref:Cytidylate kinase n=1 Tax=Desulfovibrio gilichinskyi TaxID=1519643 RepID=A0A1X7EKE5_9BACT|nr:cytidylate kinase-like family protein [Desulfovibrio gilichinskyi]SMF35391.1 Cytidylate kinase [Desulfovibrio gilichinskyi]
MAIITISRGSYSYGKEIAEKVAERLGYRCTSRDILLDSSKEFGIPEIKLIRALHDSPSVLERFTNGKERYLAHIRSSLLQQAQKDNLVYHGLAGHYFLLDIPHVFKLRITADLEDRVREEVKRENITVDEARYILKKDDEERRKWGLKTYGIDTWDSRLYDMTIHIGAFSVSDAVDIICHAVQKDTFKTTEESKRIIMDKALAAAVKVAIINIAPLADVDCRDGNITITATKLPKSLKTNLFDQIITTASQVAGVNEVTILGNLDRRVNPFHKI